jgi:hypothetical protein
MDRVTWTFVAVFATLGLILGLGISCADGYREARRDAYRACVKTGTSEADCFARVFHVVQR